MTVTRHVPRAGRLRRSHATLKVGSRAAWRVVAGPGTVRFVKSGWSSTSVTPRMLSYETHRSGSHLLRLDDSP